MTQDYYFIIIMNDVELRNIYKKNLFDTLNFNQFKKFLILILYVYLIN